MLKAPGTSGFLIDTLEFFRFMAIVIFHVALCLILVFWLTGGAWPDLQAWTLDTLAKVF